MLYLEYEKCRCRYMNALYMYENILDEKAELFEKTQPKSTRYDKERVSGGQSGNAFESYMVEVERTKIDERLKTVKSMVEDRGHLLKIKEQELRSSKDLYDRIYTLKYLDFRKTERIAKIIGYSESQTYRIIKGINKRCEKMRVEV